MEDGGGGHVDTRASCKRRSGKQPQQREKEVALNGAVWRTCGVHGFVPDRRARTVQRRCSLASRWARCPKLTAHGAPGLPFATRWWLWVCTPFHLVLRHRHRLSCLHLGPNLANLADLATLPCLHSAEALAKWDASRYARIAIWTT